MSEDQSLPSDERSLELLYNETIDHHREYLEKLHSAFNNRCEEIGSKAKEEIAKLDKEDGEGRSKILADEKKLLDDTLAELKYAINKSSADSRAKLEEIQNKLDGSVMDLEKELENLE